MRRGLEYIEFIDELVSDLNEKSSDIEFKRALIEKANYSYYGIEFRKVNDNVKLGYNTEKIYDDYLDMTSYEVDIMVNEVYRYAQEEIKRVPRLDFNEMTYPKLAHNIFPQMLNYEKNAEFLEHVPYKRYDDLAMIYRIDLSDKIENSTTVITKKMQKAFDVTDEELHEDALRFGSKNHPAKIAKLGDYMVEELNAPKEIANKSNSLWIVTNEEACYGASALFYPGVLKEVSEDIGGDFIVLPSSIHEVLVKGIRLYDDPEYLKRVVQEINKDVVQSPDVLSDNVYCYDSKNDRFGSIDMFLNSEDVDIEKITMDTLIETIISVSNDDGVNF